MALSTHGHGMAFQDRCFGVSKTSLLSKIHDFRFLFPRIPTVQAVYTGGYTQNESKASTMELYRQAREGFYLLCSLFIRTTYEPRSANRESKSHALLSKSDFCGLWVLWVF